MYIVTVQFEIHPEHAAAFREQMLLQASNSLNLEEACRQFDVGFNDEGIVCFLYEKYDDRSAFDQHLASDHFNDFAATVAPWIKDKIVQTWNQEN